MTTKLQIAPIKVKTNEMKKPGDVLIHIDSWYRDGENGWTVYEDAETKRGRLLEEQILEYLEDTLSADKILTVDCDYRSHFSRHLDVHITHDGLLDWSRQRIRSNIHLICRENAVFSSIVIFTDIDWSETGPLVNELHRLTGE